MPHQHHASAQKVRQSKTRASVYFAMAFLSLHYVLTLYVGSSYLTRDLAFSERSVGLLFTAASFVSIVLFATLPRLIARVGNKRVTLAAIALQLAASLGLASGSGLSHLAAGALFVAYTVLISVLYYNLDLFLEEQSEDASTGLTRGIYLTVANVILVITPLISGFLINAGGYPAAYIASALCLIPLFAVISGKLVNKTSRAVPPSPLSAAAAFARRPELRNIFLATFVLQFFYGWMTVYTPMYLEHHIGFDWIEIGKIFSIMLLPFALFELPLGRLADRKLGEKEILIAGFAVMSAVTLALPAVTGKSMLLWAAILFATRVGASAIEIMTETYFFKQIDGSDTEKISFFRMTRPLGYLVAPLAASGTVSLLAATGLPFGWNFVVLGIVSLVGIVPAIKLKDTL